MAVSLIKRLHLFCDIRVHEQVKKMSSIQNDIDAFQNNCDNLIKSQHESSVSSTDTENIRADVFLQTSMKLQSELIGQTLLEVESLIAFSVD